MKKWLCIAALALFSAGSTSGKNIGVFMDYATFTAGGTSPYVEIYFSFVGNSLDWNIGDNGQYQSAVDVLISISQGDSVVYLDRYKLSGPSIADTTGTIDNFLDLQRIPMSNGNYNMYVEVSDVHNPESSLSSTIPLKVDYEADLARFSDIQLVERYEKSTAPSVITKSGYDLIPLLPFYSYYYPGEVSEMHFYAELYHMDEKLGADQPYLIQYYLESQATGQMVPRFAGYQKAEASETTPVLRSFNIANLATGKYRLVMEAKDIENNIIAKNVISFDRHNPKLELDLEHSELLAVENTFVSRMTNSDSLALYIDYLYPISGLLERRLAKEVIGRNDVAEMQRFFYGFWTNRDKYNPEGLWDMYHEQVKFTNKAYSTRIQKGYNTDRGRVHLQYGTPDDRDGRPFEPGAYPYEIWLYYTLEQNQQRNVIFVFMNRDLSTNDFELIHSDAIGELNNPNWQMEIVQRDVANRDMDATQAPDRWGSSLQNNIIIPNR